MRELDRLRAGGLAGATVMHGVAVFGASSVIHGASLVERSIDLPLGFEIVEADAHVERVLPVLDATLTGAPSSRSYPRACSNAPHAIPRAHPRLVASAA